MRFGGHETFAVREGWLHKGLKLLAEHPDRVEDEYVADWLGVGRNMAKSIKHWLLATGIANRSFLPNSRTRGPMEITRFGKTVLDNDPYFLEKGTWFALHVNLVNSDEYALTWNWFFNHFLNVRFERATCYEALRRYLAARKNRQPSLKTLQRDVACLLSTYAKDVPPKLADPEDATESPFRDLGLIVHFRDSGSFGHESLGPEDIPTELIPYALLRANKDLPGLRNKSEITIREACLMPSGPGRCFNLELESFHELCVKSEIDLGSDLFQVVNLAGERVIRIETLAPEEWLLEYYSRLERRIAA